MNEINIRSIQHYLYCPHRWGLLEVDRAWAENYFVVKANLLHERAHSAEKYLSRGRRVYTSVKVWNDEYGLFGVVDCFEEVNGKFTIVEYKPTMPKSAQYLEEDVMQVFCQKLCVDSIFCCDCGAEIYYANTRKRVVLPMKELYEMYCSKLLSVLKQMRELSRAGQIPPIVRGQNCSGCSMKDMCLPSASKARGDIRKKILDFAGEQL